MALCWLLVICGALCLSTRPLSATAQRVEQTDSEEDGRFPCGQPPSIENGSYETYNHGASIAYLCDDGFMMYTFGGRKRHCQDGRWSGSTPICSAGGCSEEDAPTVENSSVQRFNGGTVRFHRCNAGFERQWGGSMVIYCDGARWRNEPGRCVGAFSSPCGQAPHVENARRTKHSNGLITYTCEPGYRRRLGGGSILCSADEQWIGSPGVCTRLF
ncbi:sushi, von Willebrand factor type A, EGF and pentraxin domain-containing protein 1-like [Acanthaster planci]|uniref:Sushi, von Willebrand factor type A, EGF and pentraxin domain-containing protein 1-like n=1 Tax=Acanthaster planci TaxID=133434 RepID=A0A8B7YG13_ACAPL|nr:sushi, von Willebrand factor type A, EGF and pentraxin domain-containing protein 1-like [Acanthaster planci]